MEYSTGAEGVYYLTPSFSIQSWVAQTFTKGEGGDDLAYSILGDYTTDRWGLFFRRISIGPDAEARSGFIQRSDLRRPDSYGRRSFRPSLQAVRKIDLMLGGNLFASYNGVLQDWAVGPLAMMEMESGASLTMILQAGENRPDEDFDLADTLYVGPGTYDASTVMAMLSTDPSRPMSFQGNAQAAAFYGGSPIVVWW